MSKIKKEIKIFVERISIEARETKEATSILITKYVKREEISAEEEEALKKQFYDVLKIAGIGIPFALIPGASILLPLIISVAKKKNIDILPSSFNEKKKENEKE